MQLNPAAQSTLPSQGPDRSSPASTQLVMLRSPSQPMVHLKPEPHAAAPASVTSSQGLMQCLPADAPSPHARPPVQRNPVGQSMSVVHSVLHLMSVLE